MQAENETSWNFSERTDALAQKLGCDLGDLCAELGMGRASFFSYRTGKRPISGKAWAKLAAAERAAGITGGSPRAAPSVAESSYLQPDSDSVTNHLAKIDERLARIEAMLTRLATLD